MSSENIRFGEKGGEKLTPIYAGEARLVSGYEEFMAIPESERAEIEAADTPELWDKLANFEANQQFLRSVIGPRYWD